MTEDRANRLIAAARIHAVKWIRNTGTYADGMPKIHGLKRNGIGCQCGCLTPAYSYDWKALTIAASGYAGRVSYLDAYDARNARLTRDELEEVYTQTAHDESLALLKRSYQYAAALSRCAIRGGE